MAHTCHAYKCSRRVKPEPLMCKHHWTMVPRKLQRAVWATYRDGQCDDWQITQEYADAAKGAITAVAEAEGYTLTGKEPELTLYDALVRTPEPETNEQGRLDL